jgi:hypothetical protein
MLGGVGHIVADDLKNEPDTLYEFSYERFIYIVTREHDLVFGNATGFQYSEEVYYAYPPCVIPAVLSDWVLSC